MPPTHHPTSVNALIKFLSSLWVKLTSQVAPWCLCFSHELSIRQQRLRLLRFGAGGLVVMAPDGREKLVMSDQEICDDIGHRRQGVDLFELATGSDVVNEDRDIAYAVVAKAELRCHLNEVLNVLITHESMKALVGKKFKKGDVLFNQHRLLSQDLRRQSMVASRLDVEKEEAPKLALIGVNIATLRPRIPMDLGGNRKTQKLCFSTFTQQYPGQDRAVHIMKTLPKELHNQLIPTSDRTALRNEPDHLSVGFHIQSNHTNHNFAGSNTHVTRIFAHGYASPTPPTQFGTSSITPNPSEIAQRRESVMNPEAKHVLNVLTKSLRQFERVVRRCRFGFQTFIYFPTGYDDPSLEKRVLPVPSASTSSVATSSATCAVTWCAASAHSFTKSRRGLDSSVAIAAVCSAYTESTPVLGRPSQHSHALNFLGQLVNPIASTHAKHVKSRSKDKRSKNYTKTQQVAQDVENYLSQSLRVMKGRYSSVGQYTVTDLEEHDNVFEFDADQTKAEHHPMPPMRRKRGVLRPSSRWVCSSPNTTTPPWTW
ncbi:hypothetical protein PC118_g14538 [Phytophthora cactorum]|uniref:Uncharacterized protein n=1 Tax=Phytophthora cactorum TaxID=29920 RepID=A0A8T1FKQ7_9STRA|nr:hypothetical protein PC118_g14538 [Phytophthora cactorum]